MRRPPRRALAVSAFLVAAVALAATSPLLFASVGITNAQLYVSTQPLPKGWFSSRGALDRTKSNLVLTYAMNATACSAAAPGGSASSVTVGNLGAVVNTQGVTTAYTWDTSVDLASFQNHWYDHQLCDGTVEQLGCDQAIPVDVSVTAYDGAGACLTYVNNAGQTVCASDTATASLPAVQDATVIDTQCDSTCGIGACVSSCEHDCELTGSGKEKQSCKEACVCTCKLDRASIPGCPDAHECL